MLNVRNVTYIHVSIVFSNARGANATTYLKRTFFCAGGHDLTLAQIYVRVTS